MHYGVFSQLEKPIAFGSSVVGNNNKGEKIYNLVLQYEVRLEEQHKCGGAYLKFLRWGSSSQSDLSEYESASAVDNDTPYSIMFGPDKCGGTNKVHFIVQIQNPLTEEWAEHHYRDILSMANDKRTHLYTIHIKQSGDFDIYLDNVKVWYFIYIYIYKYTSTVCII